MSTVDSPRIRIRPRPEGGHRLEAELWVPRPRSEVFEFFSRAENLNLLTPPWLRFRILSPVPIDMRTGALIDYRIAVHGLPLRWQSEITAWEPEQRFVDEQRRGPYRKWIHEHSFQSAGRGTICRDRVDYEARGGALLHRLLIAPDLQRIFNYRVQAMLRQFPALPGGPPGRASAAHSPTGGAPMAAVL